MTIMILFHQHHYRNFKHFYNDYVKRFMKDDFPELLSYNRFIEQKQRVTLPLFFFILSLSKRQTGVYFVDPKTIKVCHIKHEKPHKVFDGLANKNKSTMGCFFGFKLHIIVNCMGEIMAVKLTEVATDDREPVMDLLAVH